MQQSSLMTWLNKPNSVKQHPVSTQSGDTSAEADGTPRITHQTSQSNNEETQSHEQEQALSLKRQSNVSERPLPPNLELRSCTKEDIPHLKRLLGLLLPISYPEKFYKEIIDDSTTNTITLLAIWHTEPSNKELERGRLVGTIRCRLLAKPPLDPGKVDRSTSPMLYLSALAVLSPYRSFGIATHMLRRLTKRAVEDYGVSSIGAHVWEANVDGLEWYHKRGFREIGREDGYYRRLDPQVAVVVKRDVGVMDLIGRWE